ncbi:MAG: PhoH family protein [Phycisphaeraceae bacterium]|nr:PhoH family protein [Phycisphaeraceae bacterium]QYK48117.1 MAG: PhoH family protein [Phycisphaeraceae bacterium]
MELTIHVPAGPERVGLLGSAERNLKMLRETLGVSVTARDDTIRVSGDHAAVSVARAVIDRIGRASRQGEPLSREQVLDLIATESGRRDSENGSGFRLSAYAGGRQITARSENQRVYIDAINSNDLVIATGPAGTGKTYLAVAAAVHLLRTEQVRKVVLARPAVEAGEKLGFLPGDIEAKVNPYLRPLLDALHDMMEYAQIRRFMESDVVELVPLAFMRGRTLNNAAIILDEAQNTTRGQMQMFLTRMGHGSKMIITGDTTQIDLPDPRESGLIDAVRRLRRVQGIGLVNLTREDVVRHPLVQKIVDAYAAEAEGRADGGVPGGAGGA